MTEASTIPLVIDLDGTLTATDTLVESIIQLGKQHPLDLFKLPFWLLKGRASFKAAIAFKISLPVKNLPYRTELIGYLRSEKQQGRQLILATAAHKSIAHAVATHLDLFDDVLSSDESRNLKGTTKLAAIQQTVGQNFVYAGDSQADLPIWQAAQAAILVNTSSRVGNAVRQSIPIEREFPAVPPPIKVK
ncbi:MAG: haloacid dehalogenase-like hydrolase [Methylovulum sp.]|nr:haloacid dehalogenase-like hydrolase [Methylovulum sp.]